MAIPAVAVVRSVPAKKSKDEAPKKTVSLFAYAPMLVIALFKDISDLVFGWIPGLAFLVAVLLFTVIALLFTVADKVTAGPKIFFLLRVAPILIGATLAEGLAVGVNLVPLAVGSVFGIYMMEKAKEKTFGVLGTVVGGKV
jgi:hypothetical protein